MITVEKWSGLITAASPHALPSGACVEQNNIQCLQPGQIQGRNGYALVHGLGNVTSAVRYASGGGPYDKIIVLSDSGLHIVTP